MPNTLTNVLVNRRGTFDSSLYSRVTPLTGSGKPTLKAEGISRNHILANSRIRTILHTILKIPIVNLTKEQLLAVEEFFNSLYGSREGKEAFEEFTRAWKSGDHMLREALVLSAADAPENLRFGEAETNSDLSNSFDPIVIEGRMDRRTTRILNAVTELGRVKLIDWQTHADATTIARHKDDHSYASSTAHRTSTLHRSVTDRSQIDLFAHAADERGRGRSRSFEDKPAERQTVMQRAADFHNASRDTLLRHRDATESEDTDLLPSQQENPDETPPDSDLHEAASSEEPSESQGQSDLNGGMVSDESTEVDAESDESTEADESLLSELGDLAVL